MASPTLSQSLGSAPVIGNNTTSVTFTYTSDTAVAANSLKVTIQNQQNCSFSPSTPQYLVPTSDPKIATVTLKMTVTAATGTANFDAQVNDSGTTKLPSAYSGNITTYDPSTVALSVSSEFLQAESSTAFVRAIAQLKTADDSKNLPSQDIVIYGLGFDDSDDAFTNYVKVSQDSAGQTPFPASAWGTETISGITFKTLTLTTGVDGTIELYLTPIATVKAGSVTLVSRVGTQAFPELQSSDIIILDPTINPSGGLLAQPHIEYLDGIYLTPPDIEPTCTVTFESSPQESVKGYALTNNVGGNYSIIDIQMQSEEAINSGQVVMQFPYSKLHSCVQQGSCVSSDFNNLGYMIFESGSANSAYSAPVTFYLDTTVLNEPPIGGGIDRKFIMPKLYTAKPGGDPDVEITPGEWVNDERITNGLVIVIPYSADTDGLYINGTVYLNGWSDLANNGAGAPNKASLPLFGTATKMTSGGLSASIIQRKLRGYDVAPREQAQKDAGFWIEYWDANNTNNRSVFYHTWLNTQPPFNIG